jgi:glycosyltransferase involved in cell wall biosynthesis
MKPKVAHLIATNFFGGPEKQITEHLKILNKGGRYQGVLISYIEKNQKNEILEQAKQLGIENYCIPMSNPVDILALLKLMKILRESDIQLICAHHYKAVVMGWIAGRLLGLPVLDYSRGFTGESLKIKFYEFLERKIVKRMDGIIAVSHGQKLKLQSYGIKKRPFWVVHNGVEVKAFDKKKSADFKKKLLKDLKIAENALLVLAVGRLSQEKGHRTLFEVISRLSPEFSHLYFLICGDGILKEKLIALAEELTISDRIRFLGFRRDMDLIYQIADFLVLPSLTEGLPNVVLEAFAYAKPVIASNVGGIPEIVEDKINGLLVRPEDHSELLTALEYLAYDRRLRVKFGQRGFQKVKEQFTFEAQTKNLISIYNHFINLQ